LTFRRTRRTRCSKLREQLPTSWQLSHSLLSRTRVASRTRTGAGHHWRARAVL